MINNMDKEQLEAISGIIKNPNREALAEMIVEYVNPQHITTDFISLLLNTRNLNAGDLLIKKVRKGLRVLTHVPGAVPLKGEITLTERVNYVLDYAVIGARASEWELQSGEIGTVQSIQAEMLAQIRDYFMNKVFTALSTVWTAANTPDNYTDCGGVVTSTALEDMINTINETTSGAKAIVGTRAALTPITKFGTFWSDGTHYEAVPSQIEEVMKTGFLGHFLGVPLVILPQDYDNLEDYNKLIPEDKILVIGESVGEFITYGTPMTKQYVDPKPTPPEWNIDTMISFGMIIDNSMGIGVLKVS